MKNFKFENVYHEDIFTLISSNSSLTFDKYYFQKKSIA